MPERRRVHLGIDYGTCFSKIVFRDYGAPGGEQAFVVAPNGNFRIPSAVGMTSSGLILGSLPASAFGGQAIRWFESIKMRAAGEALGDEHRYCHGPVPALSLGYRAIDLAVLSFWFLISEGYRAISNYLGSKAEGLALGMTLGVPMSFYADKCLRASFLEAARAAWHVYRTHGILEHPTLDHAKARLLLGDAYNATSKPPKVPDQDVMHWVRPEAIAAMWWPFQSPAVSAGPYAKVDIGAGTTNASIFRIVESPVGGKWLKTKLAFFGACSVPMGMDAIDQALARWQGLDHEKCLTLRGQEKTILTAPDARAAVSGTFKDIHAAYRKAWQIAYPKLHAWLSEIKAWREHRLFILGGGSSIHSLQEAIRRHPMPDEHGFVRTVNLGHPDDLQMMDGTPVQPDDLPYVTVAYGLSNIGLAIPEAETPDQIPDLPPARPALKRLDLDDIYAK
jgi:hypothetical protein